MFLVRLPVHRLAFVTFEAKCERLRPARQVGRRQETAAATTRRRRKRLHRSRLMRLDTGGQGVAPITSYVTHLTRNT